MIEVQRNAYVILLNSAREMTISGRFLGVDKEGRYVLAVRDGNHGDRTAFCDPNLWKERHWHNQPKEADDSPAWVATRKQIARAMNICRKQRGELA